MTCPNCGYCPSCGHAPAFAPPVVPGVVYPSVTIPPTWPALTYPTLTSWRVDLGTADPAPDYLRSNTNWRLPPDPNGSCGHQQ